MRSRQSLNISTADELATDYAHRQVVSAPRSVRFLAVPITAHPGCNGRSDSPEESETCIAEAVDIFLHGRATVKWFPAVIWAWPTLALLWTMVIWLGTQELAARPDGDRC